MTLENKIAITVGDPNWEPLERVLPRKECANFMYMGRVGEIELYKHCLTRRHLNIGVDGRSFYRYSEGAYVEITQTEALEYVRN